MLNDDGQPVSPGSAGNICIANPWPGMMQTIYGDPDRFIETYYAKFAKLDSKDWRDWPYVTGDGATMSEDGYIRILGRVDDVINVAGHRLGTKELESAALTVPAVSEAAAVPAYDELKGRVPELYVSLQPGYDGSDVEDQVKKTINELIGPIARPAHVWVTTDLPKTRSGKIMRRVVAAISNFMDPGDTTTLANPEIVEEIDRQVREAKAGMGIAPEEERRKLEMEVEAYGET